LIFFFILKDDFAGAEHIVFRSLFRFFFTDDY